MYAQTTSTVPAGASGSVDRCRTPASHRPRTTPNGLSRADAIVLQRTAGNAAVAAMLSRRAGSIAEMPTVSRCGPAHPDCACSGAEKLEALKPAPLQRDNPSPEHR